MAGKLYFHMIYTAAAIETKIRDTMIPGWSPNLAWQERLLLTSWRVAQRKGKLQLGDLTAVQ